MAVLKVHWPQESLSSLRYVNVIEKGECHASPF